MTCGIYIIINVVDGKRYIGNYSPERAEEHRRRMSESQKKRFAKGKQS